VPTLSGSPDFEARLGPESEARLGPDLTAFLGEHTPFQAMADEELAELAAKSELVEFPVGAIVADYAKHVPGDVWMVRSGQVTLQASADATTIDAVEPGGIFGYTPLLTGGGMEFVARATKSSTLIRLPGAVVRAQFAKPAGLAFLASTAWNVSRADRPTIAPTTDSRPVGELVHGDVLLVEPAASVREADDCRYVAEETSRRIIALRLQPCSTSSLANQSSSSGCVGGFPLFPKLKTVGTSGFPKWRSHMWFIATRAVSGFSGSSSH